MNEQSKTKKSCIQVIVIDPASDEKLLRKVDAKNTTQQIKEWKEVKKCLKF